jgi:hypothetical protein
LSSWATDSFSQYYNERVLNIYTPLRNANPILVRKLRRRQENAFTCDHLCKTFSTFRKK